MGGVDHKLQVRVGHGTNDIARKSCALVLRMPLEGNLGDSGGWSGGGTVTWQLSVLGCEYAATTDVADTKSTGLVN